ncbi:MAG: hypothetical protein CVV41_10105 [Candidatus Riflebacteria bacterium HGW-Riflebacteria-1]|jgi:hypothetical protein|nr:MAG: hypothetical protein CVV41_10105 [Candidatus Riflebacteria bacterium HGW-Riflebacteria-1]
MKIFEVPVKDLKPLLGSATPAPDDNLVRSIKEYGVLQPLVISQNMLCDGHRRLTALKQLGFASAPCIEAAGSPALLFTQLNSHRELSAFELAAAFAGVEAGAEASFFSSAGTADSPQLQLALRYIADNILASSKQPAQQLPLNIWRELGHLGEDIARFALPLLQMPGTVSEKRNIAMFLRQAQRKGVLPENLHGKDAAGNLPGNDAAEVLENLQRLAQPRRTDVLDKFARALEQNPLPPGISLKIDQTFSKPGIQLTCNLTRRHSGRLTEAQAAVDAIFAAVEEL